ncbi:MAG: amidohydrolase [Candidatus Limnocylindrales bacterium]
MAEIAADLIVEGRVATLGGASGFGWVEAIAIRDGRVLAAGPRSQVAVLAAAGTRRWQLPPTLAVMPSFTDAHLHCTSAALAADQPDLNGLDRRGVEAIIARTHADRLEGGDPDGWLVGHGWTFDALGEHPHAGWLDEAAPGRPVALWSHDHHSRWLSARAIQIGGLAAVGDPPSGRVERDVDGRPTGIMYEAAAGLIDAFIPAPTTGDVDWAVGAFARTLAALGVTAVHDPGPVAPEPELSGGPVHYRELARGGHLPLRVVASVREEQLERAIEIGFRSGQSVADDERGRYRDGWLKLFADGAIGSRTAALLSAYEPSDPGGPPPAGSSGMLVRTAEQLAEVATRAAEHGIASQIHAIGDRAVRTVLDVLERLPSVPAARHRVEHAQLIDPLDMARFAALGVPASVQPCHLLSDVGVMRAAWGERCDAAFPLAALEASGALLPFGTDAPVESPDPWRGLAAAVTRRGAGWEPEAAFYGHQAIGLERALRGACLDGPRSAHIDDQGHLDAGARADLLVVPAGMFEAPTDPDVLAHTRPLATLLDGEVVYRAPEADF